MTQDLRILHVLDHSIPLHSGYAFRTKAILEHQRGLGYTTFQVTSSKQTGTDCNVETVDGIEFHRTSKSGELLHSLPIINQAMVVYELRRRLADLIEQLQPDVIQTHSPCLTALAALPVARRHGLPVVYEVRALWEDGAVDHGTSRAGGLRYRISRGLETHVLKKSDAVTTICEGLKNEFVARGIPADKITLIPNAVDFARFSQEPERDAALAAELGLSNCCVLGFIGSFYGYEGLAVLLDAVPAMVQARPDLRVLLVGGGPEEAALKAQVEHLGISQFVIFAGRVPHECVQDYYGLVDLFVYPRRSTRVTNLVTPLKPLEAMAQNKLVAASDVGGHRELIRHGETGILFKADDPESLARSVLLALQDPKQSASLRETARKEVLAHRTWEKSVSRYGPVYERLGARRTLSGVGRPG